MMSESQDALLHGQLQEGLQHHLMGAPAVSGVTTYAMLCQAAKTEERRQAELKRHRQYQSDRTDRSSRRPPSLSATSSRSPK